MFDRGEQVRIKQTSKMLDEVDALIDKKLARIAELERTVDELRGELAQSDRVADKARIAELERTVDELRGELAQSDRVADKARIAELEAALVKIRDGKVIPIDSRRWEDGCYWGERGGFTLDHAKEIARETLKSKTEKN